MRRVITVFCKLLLQGLRPCGSIKYIKSIINNREPEYFNSV